MTCIKKSETLSNYIELSDVDSLEADCWALFSLFAIGRKTPEIGRVKKPK
jgi:hypothetical protein